MTMLLVRTADDGSVIARLRAELDDARWRVIEVRGEPAITPLGKLAHAHSADATLRVDPPRLRVELWFAAAAQQPASQEIIEGSDEALLSLKVAEALRARGLPVGVGRAPDAPPPSPPTAPTPTPKDRDLAIDAPTTKRPARSSPLALELAPALLLSPGGIGPTVCGLLGLRLRLPEPLSLGLLGVVPLWNADVERSEGSARVSPLLLGALAAAELPFPAWTLEVGGGGGLVVAQMTGRAEPPLLSTSETTSAALVFAHGAISIPLNHSLRVFARALLGWTLARISMRFETREVAHFGQPLFVATVGLEASLDFGL